MKRLVVFVAVVMLAGPVPARAEETLVASAMRAAQQLARTSAHEAPAAGRAAQAQAQPAVGLEGSHFSKRTKIMIAIGAAAAFGAVAYSIDRHVVNNTPSSLGTRKD